MPAKKVSSRSKTRKLRSRSKPKVSQKGKAKKSAEALDPAASRFVRDLLIRGEAVKPTADEGDLPPGATHKILDDDKDGLPEIERERFSLY
jgi:hypothetical protein